MTGKPDHDYGTKERKVDVDITVYGATGVVSQHVLAYLTQVSVSLPRKLTVTLAGRNKTKLTKLRERMEQKMTLLKEAKGGVDSFCIFDVFVADCQDSKALLAMAKRTRVVLNCAGPFRFYGTKVVQACAETGAHYTDISDETVWAGEMRARYGPSAAESGARIVSFCGFDSVPSDIAVYVAFKALKDECKEKSVDIAKATTWYTCQGGFTSGIILGRLQRKFNYRNLLHLIPYFEADPLVLTHPKIRADPDMETTRRRFALGEWINQLPATHSIFRFGVTLPFFLASVNFKVVYATAVALKYGRNFVYRERFVPAGFKFTHHFGPVSLIPALLTQIYLLIWNMVLRMPILGFRIASWLFPPGTGLSERACKDGFAEIYAEVSTAPDEYGRVDKGNCRLKFTGDPSNFETAQFVCEAALALVFNLKELPINSEDGFGTPVEMLGDVLLNRLTDTTVRPALVVTDARKDVVGCEWGMYA